MRNKPAKLYILIDAKSGEPYRIGGEVKAYNTKGRGVKQAKKLWDTRAALYNVVRCGMTLGGAE